MTAPWFVVVTETRHALAVYPAEDSRLAEEHAARVSRPTHPTHVVTVAGERPRAGSRV